MRRVPEHILDDIEVTVEEELCLTDSVVSVRKNFLDLIRFFLTKAKKYVTMQS
jgi:hypothetical protein